MNFNFRKVLESKALRSTIGERLTLLDAMRERTISIQNANSASGSTVLNEDPVPCSYETGKPVRVKPLDHPDFTGAEAAIKKGASENAIAKARAARPWEDDGFS